MNGLITLMASSSGGTQSANPMTPIIMMVVMFALMYFMMIRPQKKRQKAEQEMRNTVDVGDEITTIGGIMGRVVTVKDDSMVIETGADRNKMKIARWALQTNNTKAELAKREQEAAREAAKAAKEARGGAKKEKKSKKED